MTPGTTVFLSRLTVVLLFTAGRAVIVLEVFVFFGGGVLFAEAFLARPLAAAVFVAAFLRLAGFEAAALLALGRLVFV